MLPGFDYKQFQILLQNQYGSECTMEGETQKNAPILKLLCTNKANVYLHLPKARQYWEPQTPYYKNFLTNM